MNNNNINSGLLTLAPRARNETRTSLSMIVCVDCGDEMHTADNVQLHHFYITLCFSTLYSVQLHTGIVQNSCTKKILRVVEGKLNPFFPQKKI